MIYVQSFHVGARARAARGRLCLRLYLQEEGRANDGIFCSLLFQDEL